MAPERRTETGLMFFGAGALLVVAWLLYFLALHDPALPSLVYAGWVALAIGLLLIFLAIRTLRRAGKPGTGQDFTHTTELVDHGIYGLVRHPLYLGWGLMYVAAIFFSQHWLVVILAVLGMGCLYGLTRLEDRALVARFGPAYEEYRRSVPGMNLPAGMLRHFGMQRRL